MLSAVEAGEKHVLKELQDSPVSEARVQAMLKEIVRRAVAGMIARQESGSVTEIPESYLGRIDKETGRIRDAQRARDWSVASTFAGEIARQNGLGPEAVESPAVARQVLSLLRRLNDLSARVERDFDDPLDVGRDLLIDHGLNPTREAMKPPMLLSEAIEKACEEAPHDVEIKIRVIGKVALAYFGDVPVASIVLEQSFEFLFQVWMLPKRWGKGHGRNRHEKIGKDLCPLQEIRDADARDAQLLEEILNLDTLSVPDKRRRLVVELIPRLTDGYLFVQRDMLNRIFRAALGRKRVGRDVDDEDRLVPSHAQLKNRLRAWHKSQKTPCKLPKRVSRPKRRMSWSLEHVSRLLRSPIYVGTSSPKQRSRKATARNRIIIRDAIYWVPLIMITMGVRPEEILQAAVPDVVRRDGILCLFVGEEEDAVLKNEQSRRVLPIPEILLELGFREWVVAKRKFGETWLFPEIQPDKSHGRRSQIFGDRLRNLLKTLKLHDTREDTYAMRRTLSSKLLSRGIDTGTRQRILGHLEGTTIDRHYSDHGLLELKDLLDSVDYGIEVGRDRRFDFPIIVGNRTAMQTALDVEVALTDRRERLRTGGDEYTSFARDGCRQADLRRGRRFAWSRCHSNERTAQLNVGTETYFIRWVGNTPKESSMKTSFTVNGSPFSIDLDPRVTLLDALRDHLNLTGSKKGCDHGQCGACTVLVDGRRINACLSLAVMHDGDEITTVEGLSEDGRSPLQSAFVRHDGMQCGYCTPGQLCSATAVFREIAEGWPSHVSETLDAPMH